MPVNLNKNYNKKVFLQKIKLTLFNQKQFYQKY